jgi:hypothetical protein
MGWNGVGMGRMAAWGRMVINLQDTGPQDAGGGRQVAVQAQVGVRGHGHSR